MSKEEWETGSTENDNNDNVVTKSLQIPSSIELSTVGASPTMLINYFTTIDRHQAEGENVETFIKDFQRLMLPAIEGNKPTIIEEAQIRQAALKANVPLDFVDAFLDQVSENDGHPEVVPQASSEEDRDFLLKGWEEIEDLNEDAAIAAFLSSKFSAPVLNKCDLSEVEDDVVCNDRSYSTVSQEIVTDNLKKENGNQWKRAESPISLNRRTFNSSDEENDDETNELSKIQSNDLSGLEEYEREGNAKKSTNIPKIVVNRHKKEKEIIRVDIDTKIVCKRIQNYDEGIWQRRTAMATYGWGWEEATWLSLRESPKVANLSGIDGLATAESISNFMFNKKSFPFARENCKLSYKRRTNPHKGYLNVDVNSLQESAAFGGEDWAQDETHWEHRYVRQRFLHERSLTFSRNWFGNLVNTTGNDKIKAPVCKPKSMEMPMRNIPDWTPEWYTTWGGSKLLLPRPSSIEGSFNSGHSDSDTNFFDFEGESQASCSYSSSSSYDDDDDDDVEWEEAPECGTIVNTKQKIGEHVTRVHPDFTSSLRKSRWRKKYFPSGSFPY